MLNRSSIIIGIAGGGLGLLALAYASIYPAHTFIIAVMATIALLLIGWFVRSWLPQMRGSFRRQATYLRINNLMVLVLALFSVVLTNLIVKQYYHRSDFSTTRRFTLSQQSSLVARSVERETEIMFFGAEGGKEQRRMRELMEMFRYLNKRITYTFYDLDRSPLKAKEFNVVEYNTLVFRSGEKTAVARGADEETVTNLIIRGMRRKAIIIGYLQGHNEHTLSTTERDGYGKVAGQLTAQGYTVKTVDLRGETINPTLIDLLVIAAPKVELAGQEYDILWDFREKGGKLLVLVDGPDQLAPFLKTFGLHISASPVYDISNVAGTDPSSPLVNSYVDTPITRNFGLSTVFPGVHAIEHKENMMLGFRFDPFVSTSAGNWFETNGNYRKDPDEIAHPQPIAAAVSHPEKLVKMVIFGDSDFATNAYSGVAGNANLFINSVNWLCGEGALVSMAPAKVEFVPMVVSEQQARILRVIAPVGAPLFFVIAGIVVWLRRRRL